MPIHESTQVSRWCVSQAMDGYIFICYARIDREFVRKLAANLKSQGVPVWLDQWDIPPGADWDQSIDSALHACAHF